MTQSVEVFLDRGIDRLKVGKLLYRDRKSFFEYDAAFIRNGPELSPYKLPLKPGVQVCEDPLFEGLFGLFADSLPDGWGHLLLDRHLSRQGISLRSITPLDRLCYIDHFSAGALRYEPSHDRPADRTVLPNLDELAASSLQILQGQSDDLLQTLLAIAGSSAGARPKAMIHLDSNNRIHYGQQPLQEGFEHYLVKFPGSGDTSHIGAIEYIYAQMAAEAGVAMPPVRLLEGKTGRYFAAKRFDRNGDRPVHMHSVAGLVHSDFRLPALDYDDLLTLTLHLCRDIRQVERIFALACFNLFAHNRDDHAKNFSFVLDGNAWKLSPAYDLTFSNGPGGEHSTTYLGEGRAPTAEHLKTLAKKHGIKEADRVIERVRAAVSSFERRAKALSLPSSLIRAVSQNLL